MWALRSSANRLRASSNVVATRVCALNSDLYTNSPKYTFYNNPNIPPPKEQSLIHFFSTQSQFISTKFLSSQTGTDSSDKEDSELEGFSDLDKDLSQDVEEPIEKEKNLDSNSKTENRSGRGRFESPLFKLLLEVTSQSMVPSLENWLKQGNQLERGSVFVALFHLRRLKLFKKALQFVEWLAESKDYEFTDRDYTTLLDFYAKVHGPHRAEIYLNNIPESMRTEVTYRTLLANYVASTNVQKSERIFNKMRDLGFPLTAFSCNQLLLLYKRLDRKKIPDILLMMEKEDLKPTLFTYKILIDVKGVLRDITGLETILDTMKKEGIEPDMDIRANVAKYYIWAGYNEKAERVVREIEGERHACKFLFSLYADLKKGDDVARVWKVCEADPLKDEVVEVMNAWGKLGEVENAEKVFDEMCEKFKDKVSKVYYDCLMMVYASNKLVDKVENFEKKMCKDGAKLGAITLDSIVKMHIELGDLNKAESILLNWVENYNQKYRKPLYNTYLNILEEYANKGDLHNTERVFYHISKIGYFGRIKRYEILLKAYVNAKEPAYGFRERMKAENLYQNQSMNEMLAKVEPFRKRDEFELDFLN